MFQVITECGGQRYAIANIIKDKRFYVVCRLSDGTEPDRKEMAETICEALNQIHKKGDHSFHPLTTYLSEHLKPCSQTKLIYLASPYSDPDIGIRQKRFILAASAAAALMRMGHFVFSPITHSHPMSIYGKLDGDWEFLQAYDRAMLSRCNELIVLTLEGWEQSVGVRAEVEIAQAMNLPVRYRSLEHLINVRECNG